MKETVDKSIQRDYDKNNIKIINYSAYFQSAFLILMLPLFIIFFIKLLNQEHFDLRILIVLVFICWSLVYLKKLPQRFKQNPSKFIFYKNSIEHFRFLYDKDKDTKEDYLISNTNNISKISYVIMTELPYQYGRWTVKMIKEDKPFNYNIDFGDLILLIRYIIYYFFIVLPYRLFKLYKNKEPLSLLGKNIFIQFDNRNYFLVNIYSKNELEELIKYFREHNIEIENKTYFIPHIQNDGLFNNKEEKWEFNLTKKEN